MAKKYPIVAATIGNPGKFLISGDFTNVFKPANPSTGMPATSFDVVNTSGFDGKFDVLSSLYNASTNRTEITIQTSLFAGTVGQGFITNTSVYFLTTPENDETIVVDFQELDETTSLQFIGRHSSGWGETVQQNILNLLCNFSSPNPPPNPVRGQLWFDESSSLLKIFIGGWQTLNQIASDPSQIGSITHFQSTPSTTWTITHNLNSINLVFNVIVDLGGGVMKPILPADVTFTSSNVLTLTFSTPRSGRCAIIRAAS